MLPVPPDARYLRTGERIVESVDMSDALLDGEDITAISAAICQVSTEPPFADQWTDDTVTLSSPEPTGGVDTATLTSAGGTYATSTTIPLTVGAPSPGGEQAVIHATTNSSGVVQSTLVIDDPGNGYTSAPPLTFPAAQSGGTATATCTIRRDTITYVLDATQAPVVVGEWRQVIVAGDTNYGETRKADPVNYFTDI